MRVSNNFAAYLKLFLAILIWSGLYHVARPAVAVGSPVLVAFLRYLVSAVILLVMLRYKTGLWWHKLDAMQWWLVFLLGALGICAYNLLFFSAEALISGNLVAILYAFTPCMATVLSSLVFKTRLNLGSKIGVVVALLGSIGVVNYATPECQHYWCSNTLVHLGRGEMYGIGATVVFACYSVISRLAGQRKVSGIVMNAYAATIGGILLGIIAAFSSNFTVVAQFGWSFWLAFFYITILSTIVAYLWYTEAILKLGVFKTVIFQNTIPLQTVLLGWVFLNETVSIQTLLCGMVVIVGVYITNIALNFGKKN